MRYSYCPYCMSVAVPEQVCPKCGKYPQAYAPEAHHFPAGQLLNKRYLVGRVLGEGGFGITYLGLDTKLERRVAIKEYFPRSLVRRDAFITSQITCYTGSDTHFERGRAEFLREAQMLAKLDDIPEIVHVLDFFSENNSAYIVMEFLEGVTLKNRLANTGVMSPKELLSLLEPVISSLDTIHKAGLIHRDISPDNLMILSKTGKVKLMDFGCARELGGGHTMTVMLKPGFAPIEQYTGYEQGPWSDVYALCATIYYCLTGRIPPVAMQRVGEDTLIPPSKFGIQISKRQENALLKGLAIQPAARWHSTKELHAALYGKGIVAAVQLPVEEQPTPTPAVADTAVSSETEARESQIPPVLQNPGETEFMPKKNTTVQQLSETEHISPQDKEEPKVLFWERIPILAFLQTLKGRRITLGSCAVLLLLLGVGIFWFAHPHSYGDWTMTEAATCTAAGQERRRCFCGSEETRTLAALGHIEVFDPAVEASCVATGLTEGSHCATCNTVLAQQEQTPKLDHVIEETKKIAATCATEGRTAGKVCVLCQKVFEGAEPIAKLEHKIVKDKAVLATCAEEGKTEGSHCSVCKTVLVEQQALAKADHTPVTDKAVVATCSKEGKTEGSHCSVCKTVIVKQQSIEKTEHDPITDEAVAATCSKEGKTEGSHCSVCNTTLVAQRPVAKIAHTPIVDQAVAATCAKEGKTEGSHCSVCNQVIVRQTTISKGPHSWKGNNCTVCAKKNVKVDIVAEPIYFVGNRLTYIVRFSVEDKNAIGSISYRIVDTEPYEYTGNITQIKDGYKWSFTGTQLKQSAPKNTVSIVVIFDEGGPYEEVLGKETTNVRLNPYY